VIKLGEWEGKKVSVVKNEIVGLKREKVGRGIV